MEPVKVPIDKSKAIKLFVIFVIAVIACALMVTRPQLFTHEGGYGFIKGVGYAGTVIFVLAATIVSNKVFNKRAGLIIDDEGITDNSMGVLFAPVPWKDIAGIKSMQGAGQNFITIMLKNPEAYMGAESNAVKRRMLELNYQSLKTPINIVASRLKIDFDKLYTLVLGELEKHKK